MTQKSITDAINGVNTKIDGLISSGGTINGILSTYGGRNVMNCEYDYDSTHIYCKFAEFEATTSWYNMPITLTVCSRNKKPEYIVILFYNLSLEDPTDKRIMSFEYFGDNFVYLYNVKNNANMWQLWAKKAETYDKISVTDFQLPGYLEDRIHWTWVKDFSTVALPDGAISPTPIKFA